MNFSELDKLEENEVPLKPSVAWLFSLADFISIVLTFFVMLYSTKDISAEKYLEIKNSFLEYINGEKKLAEQIVAYKTEQTPVIRKTENVKYLESLFLNSLNQDEKLNFEISSPKNQLIIKLDIDKQPSKAITIEDDNKLLVISKVLSSIGNQVEVIAENANARKSLDTANIVAEKLEEYGYEHKIIRTLPENFLSQENLVKNENKLKIYIIIKAYESTF